MAIYGDKKHTSRESEATVSLSTIPRHAKFDKHNLATWTDKQLKACAQGLWCSIYQSECYGTHDLMELDAVQAELEKRGFEFREVKSLSIVKG